MIQKFLIISQKKRGQVLKLERIAEYSGAYRRLDKIKILNYNIIRIQIRR